MNILIEKESIQTLADTIKSKANISEKVSLQQLNNIVNNYTGSGGVDIANADLHEAKIIYRKQANGTITISRCYNSNGQIHTNSKQSAYVAVPENLRLGCYQTTLGGAGRYAKGIMNDCVIYNYALSDDEVRELLLS